MHGNNLGTLTFIWKTTEGGGEATRNAKLGMELNQKQKLYSTRECNGFSFNGTIV